ncbi:MAG: DHHW family protein [Christensenellales bacterium]|jgi:hypothetical protein
MNKACQVLICTAMLIVTAAVSIFANTILLNERQNLAPQQAPLKVSDNIKFGMDGKPGGRQLETSPMLLTDEYIYFKDRVLECYRYDKESVRKCSEILNNALASIPEGINKYMMLIPMRISFEPGEYQRYSDDVISAIKEIYANSAADVVTLDVSGVLAEHNDEYIFFRTDHVWTALGAYYAAQKFCVSAGINMIGIENYKEHRFNSYYGTFRVLHDAKTLSDYPDYVSYYIMEDAENAQTITSRSSKDVYVTYDSPTVALSRKGYNIFIGAHISNSILHGDAENGKTLMIVGDEYSKAFAPWLTPYYENIILINPTFYNGSQKDFWNFFSDYQIADFLIMEYGNHLGYNTVNRKIDRIFERLSIENTEKGVS